jgi:Ca2+-binding RTX toxin-like protein
MQPVGTIMPSTSLVTNSGSADIDGVLSGIKWTDTALTFSFPTSTSAYNYNFGETATFGVLSAAAQIAVKFQVLANYAAVSGLTFTEITETSTTHATLRYADSDAPGTAWAYYPDVSDYGGDVWAHKTGTYGAYYDSPTIGSYGYATFLHETGHALGLKHGQESGFDYGTGFNPLPLAHDSMEYSIMTYISFVGGSATGYTNETSSFAQTLMQDDVAAIQYLYGANWTTNGGNSVYTWSATTGEMFINGVGQGTPGGNHVFMNVWDGGGIDTYDFSARTTAVSVDLRPGGWVNLGAQLANLDATNPNGHLAIGNISNSLLFQGDIRSLIENANGGSGNDIFIGNQADNVFNGNGGADTVTYADLTSAIGVSVDTSGNFVVNAGIAGGTDTLIAVENITGGSGNDVLMSNALNNVLNGGAGTDTASYANATGNIAVAFSGVSGGTVTSAALGTDTLISVEKVVGGSGNDTFSGYFNTVAVDGGAGTDTATFTSSSSIIMSANADGSLNVSGGMVTTLINVENIVGTINNDILMGDASNNNLNGGLGTDTASYANATGGITNSVDASGNFIVTAGGLGTDTLVSVENITGSAFDDVLISNAANNAFEGGAGYDTANYTATTTGLAYNGLNGIYGTTVNAGTLGTDTLTNIERINAGSGNDTFTGAFGGGMTLDGGAGIDTWDGSTVLAAATTGVSVTANADGSFTAITVTSGNATLINIENLTGSAGNDTFMGNAANNVLSGGLGTDTATFANATSGVTTSLDVSGNYIVTGAAVGTDTLISIENLTGSTFNDTFVSSTANNAFNGGAGSDTVTYAASTTGIVVTGLGNSISVAAGALGTDTLASIERVTGTSSGDTFKGIFTAGTTLDGGAGADTADFSDSLANITFAANADGSLAANGATFVSVENITGGSGNDTLMTTAANNVLNGGLGSDTVSYSNATTGVTVALDASGNATVNAGVLGTDTLIAIENLTGGSGNDTFSGNALNNRFEGGLGTDTVSYAATTTGITITTNFDGSLSVTGAIQGTDTLVGIENITGSSAGDLLAGDASNNVLDGGLGVDTVTYTNASNAILVSADAAGNLTVNAGALGTDTLTNIENITGGAFNDTLMGTAANNVLDGGAGIDTASYANATSDLTITFTSSTAANVTGATVGTDTLNAIEAVTAGSGNDTFTDNSGLGAKTFDGGAGTDTISYAAQTFGVTMSVNADGSLSDGRNTLINIENITGGSGGDTLIGTTANNILNGGGGSDTASYINATTGITVALDASGNATVNAGAFGTDTLISIENVTGGSGNDTFSGNALNNRFDGGLGIDAVSYASTVAAIIMTTNFDGSVSVNGVGIGTDTLVAIENVTTGAGNDSMVTTAANNVLDGGAGVDSISYAGLGGPLGTPGIVTSSDASGNLIVNAGTLGIDTLINVENITGSGFNDILMGTATNNVLDGGAGTDTVSYANTSSDLTVTFGTASSATVTGAGTDSLLSVENVTGGAGNDTFKTIATGFKVLDGGAGSDTADYGNRTAAVTMVANADGSVTANGTDTLIGFENFIGGSGNDTLISTAANNTLNGGLGIDTASFVTSTAGIFVELDANGNSTVYTPTLGVDTLISIENITGGSGDDNFWGNTQANIIDGGAGNDILVGGAGADRVFGGDGGDVISELTTTSIDNDYLDGGNGADIIYSNFGDDTVYGGTDTANNYLNLGDGNDLAYGAAGTDVVLGGNGNDNISGQSGDDYLYGDAGDDTIYGGAGVDLIGGGDGNDSMYGGADTDKIVAETGNDSLYGGDGDDELLGQAGLDGLYGGIGNDYLDGGEGADNLYGGDGNDTMLGDSDTGLIAGNDYMLGDAGDDVMLGFLGDDTMYGGTGNDRLYGGDGNDRLYGGGSLLPAGGEGVNELYGGVGDDMLFGGLGFDSMFGGSGNDQFRFGSTLAATGFVPYSGTSNVWDFTGGAGASDSLAFAKSIFADEAAVRAAAVFDSGNTTITTAAGGVVVLIGVNIANLTSDDFVFF